jgi:hypothetical protein
MSGKRDLTTLQLKRSEREALKRNKRGGETYADMLRRKGLI